MTVTVCQALLSETFRRLAQSLGLWKKQLNSSSSSSCSGSSSTLKSCIQYAVTYNMQGDFSLLLTEKIEVHVYNMHRLLLKSFH